MPGMNSKLTVVGALCRDPRLTGLVDAYSGQVLDVRLTVSPRAGVAYYAMEGGGPQWRVFADVASLMACASRRNGVDGAVQGAEALKCPYTGEELKIVKRGAGFVVEGGWNPRLPQPGPGEFARMAKMRNGVGAAKEAAPVVFVAEPEVPSEKPFTVDDAVLEVADKVVHKARKAAKGTTVVQVPGGVPAKG